MVNDKRSICTGFKHQGNLHEGPHITSRLNREIQEIGFTGKYTIVKDDIRKVRPEYGVVAVLRYETKPGV
jgi:transposase